MEKENQARIGMKTPALEEDCKAGRAIFFVPGNRSTIYDLGRPLPLQARIKQDTEVGTSQEQEIILAGTLVEIIQCEIGDNGEIVVGFCYDGSEGICMLNELEILEAQ